LHFKLGYKPIHPIKDGIKKLWATNH
jgi:hypothetical protein